MKRHMLVLVGALALAVVGLGDQEEPLGIVVMPPDPGALTVQVRVDKPVYRTGDSATVHFQINEPVFIYIWSIHSDGAVYPIFPNANDPENYFSQEGQYTVPTTGLVRPYELRVVEPLGTSWVQILAVTQPIPFEQLGDERETLGAEVLELIPERAEWAFDFTSFEIVDRAPPPPGTLTLRSTPSLAQVYINGVLRGWTPFLRDLAPGNYTVLVRKSGYQDETRTVTVQSGRTQSLTVRLSPVAVNEPPVAEFQCDPSEPEPGQWVQFDASASYDSDGHIVYYEWDFTGDGRFDLTGPEVFWRFMEPGTFAVRLMVTDNDGATGEITQSVVVEAGQPPVASFTVALHIEHLGLLLRRREVTFDASASHDPDGEIVRYAWDFGDWNTAEGRIVTHTYPEAGTYTVRLTVTDDDGMTDTAEQEVQVVPGGGGGPG